MKATYKIGILGLLIYGGYLANNHYKLFQKGKGGGKQSSSKWPDLGEIVHVHNGVPIYSNGTEVYESHGKHFSSDGYYYGRKWQCVEFIKRYLYDAHGHVMPNLWGHAKQYFDAKIPHKLLNPARNLCQYRNNHDEPPKANDLLVWGGQYGHVAIVTEVHQDHIVVAQQNIKYSPVAQIPLTMTAERNYILGESKDTNKPLGWLRIPE